MSTPEPHTLTTDELLCYYGDSPLAAGLRVALAQLEQAGRALTAARSMQAAIDDLRQALKDGCTLDRLQELHKDAIKAGTEFQDVDDGELGT